MTDSTQLKELMSKLGMPAGELFLGVFPADMMPTVDGNHALIQPVSFIVNYDDHDMPGTHWCAVHINGHNSYWFDSFGKKPDEDDRILHRKTSFGAYLKNIGLPVLHNPYDFQSYGDDVCGQWSALFASGRLTSDVINEMKSIHNAEQRDHLLELMLPL
jgi:hypothetical protein